MSKEQNVYVKMWTKTKSYYEKLLLGCTVEEKEWYQRRIQSCERLLASVE